MQTGESTATLSQLKWFLAYFSNSSFSLSSAAVEDIIVREVIIDRVLGIESARLSLFRI